jgi:glycosyltransferase involved in cell wall biosynthesis
MAKTGHEVRLFSVRDHAIEGVDVVSYLDASSAQPSRFKLASGYARLRFGLAKALKVFDPDIVHAHYASTNGYIVAGATMKPTILTVWGTDVIAPPGRTLSSTQRHRAARAISSASVVTSASEFMAGHVKAIASDADVKVIPFGVDTSLFAPSPPPDVPLVLVAKSLEPRYGIEHVIEAMDLVAASIPGASLTIAGAGSLRGRLEGHAERSRADIRFVGRVPHGELPTLMASAAVIVNPTVVDESFGVVILEAQAIGRPVVATRVGAVPSVCLEDRTALLVPPRDQGAMATAIIAVLERRALSDAPLLGPVFVDRNFTWRRSVEQMNDLYIATADA